MTKLDSENSEAINATICGLLDTAIANGYDPKHGILYDEVEDLLSVNYLLPVLDSDEAHDERDIIIDLALTFAVVHISFLPTQS